MVLFLLILVSSFLSSMLSVFSDFSRRGSEMLMIGLVERIDFSFMNQPPP